MYRCEDAAIAVAAAEKGLPGLLVEEVIVGASWFCMLVLPAFVAMLRGFDITVVVVVET